MSTYYYYFKYTHTLHYTVEYLINKASEWSFCSNWKLIEIRILLKRNTVKRIRNIYSELKCLRRVRLLLDRVRFIIERTKKWRKKTKEKAIGRRGGPKGAKQVSYQARSSIPKHLAQVAAKKKHACRIGHMRTVIEEDAPLYGGYSSDKSIHPFTSAALSGSTGRFIRAREVSIAFHRQMKACTNWSTALRNGTWATSFPKNIDR